MPRSARRSGAIGGRRRGGWRRDGAHDPSPDEDGDETGSEGGAHGQHGMSSHERADLARAVAGVLVGVAEGGGEALARRGLVLGEQFGFVAGGHGFFSRAYLAR